MKIRYRVLIITLSLAFTFSVFSPASVQAATSPTLNTLNNYSILGGQAVTCTGTTTTSGAVGVSPLTSITGFSASCTAGGGTHSNDASAIAAQAENLAVYGVLDQPCDQTFGAVELSTTFPLGVGPGVYCSTSSFSLSGNLVLTGSTGVWIFKTVSTLITSQGSSVTGGDPCSVWWRIGSSSTLGTSSSFIGNILTLNGVNAMNTGATLNGRLLTQAAGTVTLDANTITGPVCTDTTGEEETPPPEEDDTTPSTSSTKGVTVTPTPTSTAEATPGFPNAGYAPSRESSIQWNIIIPVLALMTLLSVYLVRKRKAL